MSTMLMIVLGYMVIGMLYASTLMLLNTKPLIYEPISVKIVVFVALAVIWPAMFTARVIDAWRFKKLIKGL